VIISLVYCFEPAGNLIQAAYVNRLPLLGENSIVHHLIWSDWIILALFPVVAFGIYRVRKWGWYLFLSFSALLIFYNLFVYFRLNPNYQLRTVILFILIITAITAVFLRKHVYAPYFNPRLRWWEVASRYRVDLSAKLFTSEGVADCQLLDISSSGCFVNNCGNLKEGDNVWIVIRFSDTEIHCAGKVVRKSQQPQHPGYGIFFQTLPRQTRKKLKRFISTLKSLGAQDRSDTVPVSQLIGPVFDNKHPSVNASSVS